MNKQALVRQSKTQAGFTLIELIVVIVILGILAATALPRFSNLGADARVASLKAAQGALAATSAMVHGQSLMQPSLTSFTNEGQAVSVVNGYPAGTTATATAAGLATADYTITASVGGAATTGNVPAIPVNGFIVIPNSVNGTATALTCFISYAASTGANIPPVISNTTTTSGCQ